jgi:iron complex outermembrane receptor protein
MKTRIALISLSLIAVCSLQAQFAIRGKVTTPDLLPLSGVNIVLSETYYKTTSKASGEFNFEKLPAGKYVLVFSKPGLEEHKEEVILTDKDVALQIRMDRSAVTMEEIQVSAVRASEKTPTTYTNLSAKEIRQTNFGQDLPFLLEGTPSTVVTSDAGAGIGYTGIRIRGVDPTRTNVTVNGIPLNDSESHGVFWVNMPDFASSAESIQVQRGVGTSSNGAAAFGSSINIKTDNIRKTAYAEVDNSVGSFNTFRNTIKAGTGLIDGKFSLDTRLSRISSDGFIDRASSNLKSFYVSGALVGKNAVLKANVFSGVEKTYQAWYGIPGAKLSGNQDSLLTHFYNNYYPGGLYETAQDSANLFSSNPNTYNYYTYENESDNYQQDHYQLHYTQTLFSGLTMNLSGHLTRGRGYYEQYRRNEDFADYGLEPLQIGNDTVSSTDLIRQRWLDNIFYGSVLTFDFKGKKGLDILAGGAWNYYNGAHFGEIIWARFASQGETGQRYYDNSAQKVEVNAFVKGNYQWKSLNVFADLQVREIYYAYESGVETFSNGAAQRNTVDFTFFNPKAGVMLDISPKNNVYASVSVAHREPVRDDFFQSTENSRPKPERLVNLEAGHRFRGKKFFMNTNYYLMEYKDQLILTGEINDVGAYVRTNVESSFRAGIEIESGYRITEKWKVVGNLSLSKNKIREFREFVDNYDNYDANGNMVQTVIEHKNTDIAFSPGLIASMTITCKPLRDLEINLVNKYVGSQFLDNTSNAFRAIDAYFVSNVRLGYTIRTKGTCTMDIGLLVNNLFDRSFQNNGYTWGYIYGGQRVTENYFYPQAGRNYMLRFSVRF